MAKTVVRRVSALSPEKRNGGADTSGKYLYAIGGSAHDFHDELRGLFDESVYAVSCGRVAALVSDVPNGRVRPERRHLAAHQAVLKALMEGCTVLPVSFGTIAAGRRELLGFLTRNEDDIARQLERVRDRVEMVVRVEWCVPDLFAHFIENHAELREARDRCFADGRRPSRNEMVGLGRLFSQLLEEERGEHTRRLEAFLIRRGCTVRRATPSKDQEIANLACLVHRGSLETFDATIEEAACLFDDRFSLRYCGPTAPHSFSQFGELGTAAD